MAWGLVDGLQVPEFQATCTLPQLVDFISPGKRVFVDDGKLGGTVERLGPEGAVIAVNHASPEGVKLKAEKGLNFPDTALACRR